MGYKEEALLHMRIWYRRDIAANFPYISEKNREALINKLLADFDKLTLGDLREIRDLAGGRQKGEEFCFMYFPAIVERYRRSLPYRNQPDKP